MMNNNINDFDTKENNISKKNTISVIFRILGWLMIILGFIIGNIYYYDGDNLYIFITFGGFALGCFSIAEIIQLLQDIRDRITPNIIIKEIEKKDISYTKCKECGNLIGNNEKECSKCLTPVNNDDDINE